MVVAGARAKALVTVSGVNSVNSREVSVRRFDASARPKQLSRSNSIDIAALSRNKLTYSFVPIRRC